MTPASLGLSLEIPAMDRRAQELAKARWDSLTKPQGSLGRLEELGVRIAGITGQPMPEIKRKVIFTAAADHGVAKEGVSAYPQEVTSQMVVNFLKGQAAINVLARQVGAEVIVVDAGVAFPIPWGDRLVRANIRPGTGNLAQEPAMTRQEAKGIVEFGVSIFQGHHRQRTIDLVGLGDMGIANTTSSSALASVFCGVPVRQVTGQGTGLDELGLERKILVLQNALELHRPDPMDPLGCLEKVGGLEIGCLAGITLAAAHARVPVVLDGFITSVAALLAVRLDPRVREYLVASHRSMEPGHGIVLHELGLEPLLELKMRLGEGTGASLGIFLIESCLRLMSQMATFEEAGVSGRDE